MAQGGRGIAARAAAAVRRNLEKQRLRVKFVRDGLRAKVRPLEPIPYPAVDMGQADPVASIVAAPAPGTLHIQCALRGHGDTQAEAIATASRAVDGAGEIRIEFPTPLAVDGSFYKITAESWLSFAGAEPLRLARPAQVF